MAFVKYSMGGPITSVEDKDTVEKREETAPVQVQAKVILICKKCGIQHAIRKNETRVCCGTQVKTDNLS